MFLVAVGAGMLVLPRLTAAVLALAGVRRLPDEPRRRVAAWMLVVIGLVVAFLGRLIR